MKKLFLLCTLFFTTALFAIPQTKEEKKIDQHNRYLKRKQLNLTNYTLSKSTTSNKVRHKYFNHPLLKSYHQALMATSEYKTLQQVRAQSHAQCFHTFKQKFPGSKISDNKSAYNKLYYDACKDASKALRKTSESKAYNKLILEQRQQQRELEKIEVNNILLNDIQIDDDLISVSVIEDYIIK